MEKEPIFDYIGFLIGSVVRIFIICGIGSLLGEAGLLIGIIVSAVVIIGKWRYARIQYFHTLIDYLADHPSNEFHEGLHNYLRGLGAKGTLMGDAATVFMREDALYHKMYGGTFNSSSDNNIIEEDYDKIPFQTKEEFQENYEELKKALEEDMKKRNK